MLQTFKPNLFFSNIRFSGMLLFKMVTQMVFCRRHKTFQHRIPNFRKSFSISYVFRWKPDWVHHWIINPFGAYLDVNTENVRNVYRLSCGHNEMCWQILLSAILFNGCDKKFVFSNIWLRFFPVFYTRVNIQAQKFNPKSRSHTISCTMVFLRKIGKMWRWFPFALFRVYVSICITNDANTGKHCARQLNIEHESNVCINKNSFHCRSSCVWCLCAPMCNLKIG